MTIIKPVPEFEHFLNRLSEENLRLLNRMVVERLKLYYKARHLKELAKFNLMDRVYFVYRGRTIFGTIIKLNQRSATIKADDNKQWNISPSLLVLVNESIS